VVRILPVVSLVFSLFLLGCPPIEGVFDLSELPAARYGESYSGRVAIEDYDGAASFTLVSGSLPDGLTFNEAGVVEGTPTWAGNFELTVLATGMKRVDDFQDTVTLRVLADEVEGTFLGYEHGQVNNMTERFGMMTDVWVRLTGTGVDGVQSWTMDPGIYLPGDNGTEERGWGDDVRIGDVDFEDLEMEFSNWVATNDPVLHDYVPNDGGTLGKLRPVFQTPPMKKRT